MGRFNKNDPYYNNEGYADSTAGIVVSKIMREEREQRKKEYEELLKRRVKKDDTFVADKFINKCFIELLNQGVIYQPPKDAIFDFVDAFLKGKVKTSLDLLQQSYAVGESTIVLLSVLYNNIKQVLMVQECGNKDIAKTTGLTGWQIKCAKEKMGYWSTDDLIYFLKLIRKVEKGIKSGLIEDNIAMNYIIVNMF